jgi:hypothetical protein
MRNASVSLVLHPDIGLVVDVHSVTAKRFHEGEQQRALLLVQASCTDLVQGPLCRVLVQELLITNDRAIGSSLTSPYGETRIPLATTPPLGGVRWRHDYRRRGKSTPFATIVISCSEQDHMPISVLVIISLLITWFEPTAIDP